MMNLSRRAKGLLLGSRIRSDESHQILLPNQLAASLFTANMLSSVAYVPQFVLMVLAVAGASAITWGLGVGLAIAFLLLLVVGAQHTIIRIYPGGGGDYQVVKHNLGYRTAASVAAGFMVDYALTVALCLSMMVHMFAGIAPGVMPYTPPHRGRHPGYSSLGQYAWLCQFRLGDPLTHRLLHSRPHCPAGGWSSPSCHG